MNAIKRVVQITDTHLFSDTSRALKGINTDAALTAVLDAARPSLDAADLLLLTGDLAHDEAAATYRRLAARLAAVSCPIRAIPGNHDDPAELYRRFGPPEPYVLGAWVCVPLDSHVDGEVPGRLADAELARLDRALRDHAGRHVLLAVHHHPVDIGSPWMGGIDLRNHDELFALLRGHGNVRALVNGHIHQECDRVRDGVRVLGTPSTNVQFAAGSAEPAYAALEPGFRRLSLHPDGRIDTDVVRVPGIAARLNRDGTYA